MSGIKDDMQFILETKNSQKFKDLKDFNFNNLNNSMNIMDSSFSNVSENLNNENSFNNNNINNSLLNNSSCTVKHFNEKIRSYNLNEKFEEKNLTKFQEFLTNFSSNKNILLLVDSKSIIWEIIKRKDLDISKLNNEEFINSCSSIINMKNFEEKIFEENDRLMNIEIKENEEKSFADSALDISKVSDMNISLLIRDTNINETDL